jgi:CheY-like chemotaxis protein
MSALHEFNQLVGIRVLVVEDHDDSRDILEQALQHAGAFVVASRSADEALVHTWTRWKSSSPTSRCPGMMASGCCTRRRERPVPVIAVSGYSDLQERALREAGFTKVLRKPIDPWLLCREIAAAVRPRSS